MKNWLKIQTEFKSKKSRFNSFGKYNFRSAEDISRSNQTILIRSSDITVTVNEKLIADGPIPVLSNYSCYTATAKVCRIHAKAIVGVDLNQKGMQTPQQFGSASSYGKKYALGNLFLIDDTQDSDATNTHKDKLADIKKAKSYIQSGGKIDAIKKKYQLTPEQEKELTTL